MDAILAIDPGEVTGFAFLEPMNRWFQVWQEDKRGATKEEVSESVTSALHVAVSTYEGLRVDIVAEDFVLRHGQAVNITPMHTLGAIDEATGYSTYKYSPGTHKNGNRAYDISKMITDRGYRLEGDHKADALSLAIHHFKLVDTKRALEFLEDYKK